MRVRRGGVTSMMESDDGTIRLAIQSSHRQARRMLADRLDGQPDIDVVGDTSTLGGLGALCALRRPDVCVVDDASPAERADDQLQELRNTFPGIDFLVVSSCSDTRSVLHAVRRWRDPTVRPHPLTDRELSVVSLMGAGRSVADMAELLRISPHTVGNHKRGIYAKFGVGNQSQAISRAISLGLIGDASHEECMWSRPDPGRPFVAVVRGPAGNCRDEVIVALLEGQIAFAVSQSPRSPTRDHWARWHRGGLVTVLVDPDADAWLVDPDAEAWQEAVPAVVVHSAPPGTAQAVDAVLHGASALLTQADVGTDLCDVLALVARGYLALNSSHVRLLATWISELLDRQCPSVFELTDRERDILASIACGHTVRQTAQSLGIATKTVENTQTRLFRKLGTHNRSETVLAAYRLGMITQ